MVTPIREFVKLQKIPTNKKTLKCFIHRDLFDRFQVLYKNRLAYALCAIITTPRGKHVLGSRAYTQFG
jgi:hypothetical protein